MTTAAFSQAKYPKTLLWRISGNGLKKPSYLFGTIHLNDKRLFNFTDSVYKAIENTEGMAIEISPDEMGAYVLNDISTKKKGRKLSEVLSKEDFERFKKRLAAKFKKPATEVTTADVMDEKNKWIAEYYSKGEMPTFVDAYLYNIAKRQGKWGGGIEDMADQDGLEEEFVDKTDVEFLLADSQDKQDKSTAGMIRIYLNQDLDSVEILSNLQDEKKKDAILTKRNIKMARRMDSLSAIRTMFFAVGAAHLPGDDGVISLLEKRGFTVEPVLSNNRISTDKYTFKEVPLKWETITGQNGLYTVSMPGNPSPLKVSSFFDMQFLLDITNMSAYSTAAIVSSVKINNADSMFMAMAKNMFPGKKGIDVKNIDSADVIGREFTGVKDLGSYKIRLLTANNVIYMLIMYATKKEALSAADANKFFGSFVINKSTDNNASSVFTDSIMGISLVSTVPLTYNKQLSNTTDASWKITSYVGTDATNNAYIMLFSKDVKRGKFLTNDSLLHEQMLPLFVKDYPKLSKQETSIQGFPVMIFTGKHAKEKNVSMKTLSIIRGNRNILLMAVGDSTKMKGAIENIFSSVKLLPVITNHWAAQTAPNGSFSAWSPSGFIMQDTASDNVSKRAEFYAYDTTTATSYAVIVDTINKYYWAKNDSVFWKTMFASWEKDGNLTLKTVTVNGIQCREFVYNGNGYNIWKRGLMVPSGNSVYTAYTASERSLLYEEDVNKYFASFKLSNPVASSAIGSKAALLLKDLSSADSATRGEATTYLTIAPFTEDDLPLLHEALFTTTDAAIEESGTNINTEIAGHIQQLQSPSSVAFIRDRYGKLTGRDTIFKNVAIETLAGIHTADSYKTLAAILQGETFTAAPTYDFIKNLTDSLALTATIYPALLTLGKGGAYAPSAAKAILALIDSGFIKKEDVAAHAEDFVKTTRKLLPALKKKDADSDFFARYLVKLLGRLSTPECISTVQAFQYVTEDYLKMQAVIALVGNGQQADTVVVNKLAASRSTRSNFYGALKEVDKQQLFPKKYLTQKAFAEAALYDVAAEDEELSQMTFIAEKVAAYGGKKYKFYLYKVSIGEGKEQTSYLGIAGGYKLAGNDLEEESPISGVYWEKKYNADKIEQFFKAYLKQFEEE